MMISVAIIFKYMERFVSISYYQKAVSADTILSAETNINKAVSLYTNDLYLRTYAQIYLLKADDLVAKVTKGATLTEAEKADLQTSFDQAIKSAQMAVDYNKTNYLNYETLGSVYEAGVSFGAKDAFDKAVSAYQVAGNFNPLNPSLKLDLARLFFASGKNKEAKDYANEALNLKTDYVDALIMLSQIARNEGDNDGAISYAESALYFYPDNQNLKQYVDSLKNGSAPAVVPNTSTKDAKKTDN
jgi:tetratricopeptide (TPR) repeat protein